MKTDDIVILNEFNSIKKAVRKSVRRIRNSILDNIVINWYEIIETVTDWSPQTHRYLYCYMSISDAKQYCNYILTIAYDNNAKRDDTNIADCIINFISLFKHIRKWSQTICKHLL